MRTVFKWVKACKAGKFSVEDDTRPGRPKTSVTKANITAIKIVVEQHVYCLSKIWLVVLAYQKAVCKQFWKSVWTWERFVLGGYLICSLRSKRHNAWTFETYKGYTSRVISNLLTGDETWVHCLSHKEGLIRSNGSEKIKTPMYCQENHKFQKRCWMQFSLIQVGQLFKCLVHLVIQSLADSTRILYWRKWKSFNIRNDQAKDGQGSTFYMTKPPLISVRLLSLFWLLKRWKF